MKLGNKEVIPVCYKNEFSEMVEYELHGARNAVHQVVKNTETGNYYIRNAKNLKIVALNGNYTLTNKNGYLECQ